MSDFPTYVTKIHVIAQFKYFQGLETGPLKFKDFQDACDRNVMVELDLYMRRPLFGGLDLLRSIKET